MRTTLAMTLAAVTVAAPAFAENAGRCAERTAITERLKSGYGEQYVGGGLRNAESIFEVWQSAEHGTWTILMTLPDGRSCVMAAGTNWRDSLPEQAAGIPG
jgi:hypothetical protein